PLRGGTPSDDDQVPGGDVEPVGARLGAHDDVLDARAVGPGQVDAGLDGEGEAGLQRLSVAGDDVRVLVAFDADAVAGAVDEVVRSEEHTSELQSRENLVCRLLLEKKN